MFIFGVGLQFSKIEIISDLQYEINQRVNEIPIGILQQKADVLKINFSEGERIRHAIFQINRLYWRYI